VYANLPSNGSDCRRRFQVFGRQRQAEAKSPFAVDSAKDIRGMKEVAYHHFRPGRSQGSRTVIAMNHCPDRIATLEQ
jgi:hypothetical protein